MGMLIEAGALLNDRFPRPTYPQQAPRRSLVRDQYRGAVEGLLGDLDRVLGCIRLGGFVNATPDFTEHPAVINGASDLMVAVFGDAGRHTRAAIGCSSLPRDIPVEIEGTFEAA
jgi:enamine deaminase RidA (YjgF/YER057c/UK114 family)